MLNDALSSFCPTGQKSCEIRRTNWYQQICGYHLFFLKKLHQTKHRFSCAYFLGGLYQVHIVLTSHQTFHHQTFTQAILPSEMLDHFFDTSRLNCSFFTFFPACFSRKSERDNIPRISRNLWQACAKPWEYNQVALNAEWRPVLFLTCSTDSTFFSNCLPACCLDSTKRYIFGHWIQVTFAVAHDVLICHGVFISWIVS